MEATQQSDSNNDIYSQSRNKNSLSKKWEIKIKIYTINLFLIS